MIRRRKGLVNISFFCLLTPILALVAKPSASHAVPETDYAQLYQSKVLPFYNDHGRFGTMLGKRGLRLEYAAFENPIAVASIVIAPGYNESFRKYAEVAYDLFQKGFSVYILDHRGEGASARFLRDSKKGYVDRFSYFVSDLKKFVDDVVPAHRPRFLLAHSLGGAIGALYLERHPHDFHAAVLSSPMFEIDLGRPEWLATIELAALAAIGKSAEYVPGTGDYDPAQVPFERNTVTHSRARFENNMRILSDHPELFLAGQTVHWVLEGIRGSFVARTHGALVKAPVLVLQAGDDKIVKPGGQKFFCAVAKKCRLVPFAASSHEILQETDAIRSRALAKISAFFIRHAEKVSQEMQLIEQAMD